MNSVDSLSSGTKTQESKEHIFFRVGKFNFAIPAEEVLDVLENQYMTRIPLASSNIIGMHNLRGRIVTCLNLKQILDIASEESASGGLMVLVFKYKSETYSVAVDEILSITKLAAAEIMPPPTNLSESWSSIAKGIYNGDGELKVIIDFSLIFAITGWDIAS